MECRALSGFAFYPDPSTVSFDDLRTDMQPKPQAGLNAALLSAYAIYLKEAVKNLLLCILGDAYAKVLNRDCDGILVHAGANYHFISVRRILCSIVDKVYENLPDTIFIRTDHQ